MKQSKKHETLVDWLGTDSKRNMQNSGTSTNLLDVFFFDLNNGYAVGWNGTVLKTSDAGATWTASNSGINTAGNLTGVAFTSVNTGYITGLSGYLYETIDGGATWTVQSTSIGSLNLFETQFISANIGFVVGENSAFLKTIDGGANWTSVVGGGIVLSGIFFTDASTGYAVGNYQGTGIIQQTTNGGANWSVALSAGANKTNVHFPSSTIGYAVGYSGEIYKIHVPSYGTDIQIACDSYTWIDGNTYTSNNSTATYTIPGGASNGNDSIVTLNLTINTAMSGTDVRTECVPFVWIDGNTYVSSTNAPTYTFVGGAANGCDSIVTLNFTANSVNTTVSQTDAVLTAVQANANYQWVACPSMTPISGATNQSFTATSNGDYAVMVTENGCTETSACYTVSGLGIDALHFDQMISVFPNPSAGDLSIDLGAMYSTTTVRITDVTGRTIRTESFQNSQLLHVKLSEPEGAYLLMISADGQSTVVSILKKGYF